MGATRGIHSQCIARAVKVMRSGRGLQEILRDRAARQAEM